MRHVGCIFLWHCSLAKEMHPLADPASGPWCWSRLTLEGDHLDMALWWQLKSCYFPQHPFWFKGNVWLFCPINFLMCKLLPPSPSLLLGQKRQQFLQASYIWTLQTRVSHQALCPSDSPGCMSSPLRDFPEASLIWPNGYGGKYPDALGFYNKFHDVIIDQILLGVLLWPECHKYCV